MKEYTERLSRGVEEYGDKFDSSSMDECEDNLKRHYHGGRVKVSRTYGSGEVETRFGRVSSTTGWKPALLLMSRASAIGSSDVLSAIDRVIAVQVGGKYIPIN